ncbi:PREDICTED: muscle M-line assembly protein unc-89 isoform X2 [Nicrophorus vespilloides]|uniref:Muscle M-line assembly protein unc-89 isoform X2 n=1 Tax=Nicrophorus vespilloides TaxID=110193 RepID=A0ABM1MK24_NICVS|nr:PREDICTED: muscle M-line assembly protein unc-89 isoform X2 [Nicrophorus vespilloides]
MFFILRHPNAGELMIAWQKYSAIGPEELNLQEGDLVELLDTEDPTISSPKRARLDPELEVKGEQLLDSAAAKHKLSVKPKRSRSSSRYSPTRTPLNARWLVRMVKGDKKQGWVPCQVLQTADEPQPGTGLPGDAAFRRQAVVKELVETEQEFVRDLDFVVQNYLIGSEREPRKPKLIKDNFELIFGNLKEISEFHRTVLMEGVKYYANEPHLLGKAFLRLERDFDKHVSYCKEEPLAQSFLDTCDVAREYFEELSHRLNDDKTIAEHLKLPIQRINDYQLLLKELVRYSACLGEDNSDLQKALELMLSVPHRAQDDKFTNSIEGYRGSIHKLGRLLAHDWFSVCFGDITKERYLFLFKARILISKVRRISEDRSVFQLKDIIRLPQVEVKDHPDDPFVFELFDKTAGHALTLTCHREQVKDFWLKEIKEFATEIEEGADDLQVLSGPASPPEPVLQQYQLPKEPPKIQVEVAQIIEESKLPRVVELQKKEDKVVEKKAVEVEKKGESVSVQKTVESKVEATSVIQKSSSIKTTVQTSTQQKVESVQKVQSSTKVETTAQTLDTVTHKADTLSQKVDTVPQKVETPTQKVEISQQKVETISQKIAAKSETAREAQSVTQKVETTQQKLETTSQKSATAEIQQKVEAVTQKVESASKQIAVDSEKQKLVNPVLSKTHISVDNRVSGSAIALSRDGSKSELADYGDSFRVNVAVGLNVDQEAMSRKHVSAYGTSEGYGEMSSSYSRYSSSAAGDSLSKRSLSIDSESRGSTTSYSRRSTALGSAALDETSGRKSLRSDEGDYSYKRTSLAGEGDYSYRKSTALDEGDYSYRKSAAVDEGDYSYRKSRLADDSEYSFSRRSIKDKHHETSAYDAEDSYVSKRRSERLSSKASVEDDFDADAYVSKIKSDSYRRLTSTDSTDSYKRSLSNQGEEEDRLAKFEKYSRRSSSEQGKYNRTDSIGAETNERSDSFQTVTQSTVFDGKILEDAVKKSKSKDIGMAPPDETPKFTKTLGGIHIKLTEEEKEELKKPDFTVKLKDTELLEDTYLRFMLKIRGEPHPILTFYKDNVKIQDSERIKVNRDLSDHDFYELVIPDVKPQDAGVYKCVAINEHGEACTEAKVTVTESKHLFDDLPNKEIPLPPGEKPSFIWKKDGKEFEAEERFKVLLGDDEDSLALIFQHVKPEDAGLYTCVAQTTTGNISCSAELTVQGTVHELYREPEKPQLIIEKREAITSVGGSCIMELQVKGFPKPKVTWKHEGEAVEPSQKYKFLHEDEETMSLVIKNVEAKDAGRYEITAENELGQDIREMHLTVKAPPTICKMTDTTASTEQELKMTAEIDGIPKPTVQFYKDGKIIKNTELISIVEEGNKYSIVIKNTTLKDSGSYSVVASNEMAQVSQFWNLEIYCKPKILKKIGENKSISQKAEVELSIKMESQPPPEITWFKDGVEIKSDGHYIISDDGETYKLKITGSVTTDSASYKVRAKNIHGTSEDEARVDVKRAPTIVQALEDMTVTEHDKNVTLGLKVDAFPKPTVKWFLDEVEIQETRTEYTKIEADDGLKLVIKEVGSELSGKYTCKVINELGETSTSAKLTVNCKPKVIKQLKDTTVEEGATLHLECEVEAVPEPTVKWLRNGKEVSADARIKITRDTKRFENYHLSVNLIKYEEQGEYEIQVTNTLGTVSSKSNVTVHKVSHTDAIEEEAPVKLKLIVDEVTTDEFKIEEVIEEPEQCQIGDKMIVEEGKVEEPQPIVEEEILTVKKRAKSAGTDVCEIMEVEEPTTPEATKPAEPQKAEVEDDDIEALLERAKKQRSLVEEIGAQALPTITESNMKDRSQFESLGTVFSVTTNGNPAPTAAWTLNGSLIKPGANQRFKIMDEGNVHKLEIIRLQPADAGVYECTISNCVGDIKQQSKLEIIPEAELRRPKVREGLGLQDTTVIKKKEAVLKAVIVGEPVPEFTWCFKGKEITPEEFEKYKMVIEAEDKDIEDTLKECTFSLTIPRCERINGGEYSLKLKNKWGETTSSGVLTVVLSPEIEGPDFVKVVPGDATELTCIIQSNPKAIVTWTKSENVIEAGGDIEILEDLENERYTLKFNKVQLSDEGYYKVYAKNEYGEANSEGRIKTIKEPEPSTEKPQFITGLTDGHVEHGGEISLMVRADGLPRPEIKWFLNNKEIVDVPELQFATTSDRQITSTMTIINYGENDSGLYKVTATNVVGDAETSAKVTMLQTPPSFAKRLERSEEVNEGEKLELKAKISGSPKPQVAWYKDGEKIDADDKRIKTEHLPDGTVKLKIVAVTPADSGAYKLVVKNQNGETAGLCAVVVNASAKRPKFTKCIKDTKVMVGEPLKLTANVAAYPPPEIKWMKDGLPVRASSNIHMEHHPDGTIALVVDNVRPENAGKYTLIVANKVGEITGEANVEIEKRPIKPDFITRIYPQTVVEGFPVKFEVKVSGFPQPSIIWRRNGAEVISDNKHIKITDLPDGGSALVIDACDQLRDALTYYAIATNEAGEAESSALLTVTSATKGDQPEERPMFLHALRDIITDEGQELKMEAPFTGNPIPSVEWTKDGQPIVPSDRILLTCDGKKVGLRIDHSLPSDAGLYGVRIVNPLGSETSQAKASVHKVFQAPSFTQRFTDLQQLPKRDAKFPVRVSGVPQPEVSWSKDGVPLRDSDKYRIKRDGDACCLYIANCLPEDEGSYTATATNKEGQDTCMARLEVVKEIKTQKKIEPANFVKRIGDTELYKGMTAKFTACAAGIPEPTVEWYRNDQRMYPADRIKMEMDRNGLLRLTVAGVDQDDLGKYTCKIYNDHGSDSCDAYLRFDEGMEARPKKPITDQYSDFDKYKKSGAPMPLSDAPIISRMTDRHCTLSWKPSIPSGPRFPVTYQLEMLEHPHGDWFTVRSGIRSCCCDVRNLEPFRDYKFRVRVENKYGISDPSPYAMTHREKLEPEPIKFMPYLPPGIDFRPETSPYFPKDFDIDRPPHDNMAQAPRFLRQEHDAQYGVKDQNTNLFWFVYGYPKPKMAYYFNDELIEPGGRFDMSYTRNGQATLFINKMLERDVGWYEAVATNEHGEARQRVRLEIAEAPIFIRRPDIEYVMVRGKARFEARILGVPYPEIKWYRDWKPVANSTRIKIQFMEPDTAILVINDAIFKDEGLYSVSARNVAGSISSSAMLHIEENDLEYNIRTYNNPNPIKLRKKPYSDAYDIGDELGRGTQGVTYHAVERLNGRNYAAKIMHSRGELKPMMYNEWEIMNQLHHRRLISLHDAYEHDDCLALVMELAGGGELVKDYLIKQEYYTESEIAGYIRQLLQGLQYMHERGFGHMGLNIGDLLLSHPGSDELKIGDFGLSRRVQMGRLYPLKYGMPEYVSPEAANGEGTGLGHDMWSVGIITYILLSGHSPFRGMHDMETLMNIQAGKWKFEDSWWSNMSLECRDFISKLLIYQADGRLDVHAALRHPWLERADKSWRDEYMISTTYLRDYFVLYREWYDNASCRKWFRRRPLEGAFTHPSRMVYPPGERSTPPPAKTPERVAHKPRTWEDQIPTRSPLNYEIGAFKSESHYQNGPDTYLLQLRDVDFPVRLREYMKVAGSRGPGHAHIVSNENGYDWATPVIRERRRFTDVMDEEIDDERKARISKYGTGDMGFTIRRLRHEIGTRLDTYAEAEAFLESKMEGRLPFFREKPQITALQEGKDLEMICMAVGDPDPIVQWFKNDAIIAESHRIKIQVDEHGRSHLKLSPALGFDAGLYKVVARNKIGQTISRTRIVLGTVPDAPDSPEGTQVSDTEVLLSWKQPKHDGHSPVICYSVQFKLADDMEWSDKANNIDHEFYLMKELEAGKNYIFRLAAKNEMGWSDFGVASPVIMTQPTGAAKVQISKAMMHLQQITDAGGEVVVEPRNQLDYNVETKPVDWIKGDPQEKYNFISEIARGKFSAVVKALDKSSDQVFVAKLIDTGSLGADNIEGEFAALRSLRHERIATLFEAYRASDGNSVFIMEKLQGADVLTYLSTRHEYTEQTVAIIVSQVLDGIQYLHWRGLCHLDLQPDNVVMCGVRSVQVKLVDFGSAHRVTKLGNKVPVVGHPDYVAPEVLSDEPAFPQTDIWQVGVLTYVMLSGTLPFKGADDNESRQNTLFVRFRFEHLYKEVSQEGVRFVMLLFKRHPNKRPTAEECQENRWLLPTDSMIKKRERAVFLGNRLKEYSEAYHAEKSADSTSLGGRLNRSQSLQEELLTAPF